MRRRRGLISAIGAPVCEGGSDNPKPLRQETVSSKSVAIRYRGAVSFNPHRGSCHWRQSPLPDAASGTTTGSSSSTIRGLHRTHGEHLDLGPLVAEIDPGFAP